MSFLKINSKKNSSNEIIYAKNKKIWRVTRITTWEITRQSSENQDFSVIVIDRFILVLFKHTIA